MPARLLACVLILLTAACGGPPRPADVDLEPLLIQAGDLPAGMTGAQVRDTAPAMFDAVPKPDKAAYQQLQKNGSQVGGVTVLLYSAGDALSQAYTTVVDGMDDNAQPIAGVGEKAVVSENEVLVKLVEFAFTRCSALAHVRMVFSGNRDEVTAYAKRLDTRLQSAICG